MKYAGFWIRSVAFLIDFVLVNGFEQIVQYLIAAVFGLSAFNEQVVGALFSIAITYYYYCRYQVRTGTTIGKKLFNIYVISVKTGQNLTHRQAVVRLLGYVFSTIIMGCGFLMAAFHPQRRTLHDLMAGTVCIRKPKE